MRGKIVLVQLPSPFLISDRDLPLMGLLYLAASLRRAGIEVQVADLVGQTEENWFIPEGDVYGFSFVTAQTPLARRAIGMVRERTSHPVTVIVGGAHASALPEWCLKFLDADFCFKGEADNTIVDFMTGKDPAEIEGVYRWTGARGTSEIKGNYKLPRVDMTAACLPARDMVDIRSFHRVGINRYVTEGVRYEGYLQTGRGCPFDCLGGDTLVNTVEGMIPIKELADTKESIGVFTYDFVEQRAKVSTAYNISMRRAHTDMVRVHFDDGTHIDCTPDHEFVAFKWGNQFIGESEWREQAKNLQSGQSVRAIKEATSGPGDPYVDVSWRRRSRQKKHRMVLEWKLGRRLAAQEEVHHLDGNTLNNHPDNLVLVASHKEHINVWHPEFSERMQTDNPTKNGISALWAANLSKASKGRPKTEETKQRMREAWIKRREVVNHKVISVEKLEGKFDTYCLEVPETGWFYANNVLVKNCAFCAQAAITGRVARNIPVEHVITDLEELLGKYECDLIYIEDDLFVIQKKRVLELCKVFEPINFKWHCLCRADTMDQELADSMARAGCKNVTFGFETGSDAMLLAMDKGETMEETWRAIGNVKAAGMGIRGQMIVGFPGETQETIEESAEFVRTAPVDKWGFHMFSLLPGTQAWRAAVTKGEINMEDPHLFDEGFETIGKPGQWSKRFYEPEQAREWLGYLRGIAQERNIYELGQTDKDIVDGKLKKVATLVEAQHALGLGHSPWGGV